MNLNQLHITAALIAGQTSRAPGPAVTVSPLEGDPYAFKDITPGVVFGDFRFHAPDWNTPRSKPFQPRLWEPA